MRSFTFGVRYGLVPYEQTDHWYIPKEKWDEMRFIGIRVVGTSSNGILIEPWRHIDQVVFNTVKTEYICEWEEPSLNDWGIRALNAINRQYGNDIVKYCKKKPEIKKYPIDFNFNDLYPALYRFGSTGGYNMAYDYYRFSSRANAIKDVKFNGPATIVFWGDGTKTIVKAQNGEPNDPEKAIAMCISKHFLGTNKSGSNYYDNIKKWLPKEEKKPEPIATVVEKEVTDEGVKVKLEPEATDSDEYETVYIRSDDEACYYIKRRLQAVHDIYDIFVNQNKKETHVGMIEIRECYITVFGPNSAYVTKTWTKNKRDIIYREHIGGRVNNKAFRDDRFRYIIETYYINKEEKK